MRFSSILYFITVVGSVSAIAIPKHIPHGRHAHRHHKRPAPSHDIASSESLESTLEGRYNAQQPFELNRRSKFWAGGGGSSSSSSGGSGHSSSSSSGGSGHSSSSSSGGSGHSSPSSASSGHVHAGHGGGSHTGSDLGIGDLSSLDHVHSPAHGSHNININAHASKITFSDTALQHLDDLNLHGAARRKVKKEHRTRVQEEMRHLGATHATIEHLAHAQGSVDPNVHITATFQQAKAASNGGIHKEPIRSTYTDHSTGETVHGTKHHVYVNKDDKTRGAEVMAQHYPAYDNRLKKKNGGVARYRRGYYG